MPKHSEEEYQVELSPEWVTKIEELCELSGKTFEDQANEVINECLMRELPGIIAEKLRQK